MRDIFVVCDCIFCQLLKRNLIFLPSACIKKENRSTKSFLFRLGVSRFFLSPQERRARNILAVLSFHLQEFRFGINRERLATVLVHAVYAGVAFHIPTALLLQGQTMLTTIRRDRDSISTGRYINRPTLLPGDQIYAYSCYSSFL